jgi:pimeloyl-ACP methyl ester carboxylesterase
MPGAIHSGFVGALEVVLGPVMRLVLREVAGRRADSVQVVGHSLGAGVATLLAYALQRVLNLDPRTSSRSVVVDAALFAPPRVGDVTFVDSFDAVVNARNIVFQYDLLPQLPCSPAMPACTDVLMPTNIPPPTINGTAWPYSTAKGIVQVVASQMPVQPQAWSNVDTLDVQFMENFLFATHVCSYLCNFAQFTGDPRNNCLLWNVSSSTPPLDGIYCDMFPTTPPYPPTSRSSS